MPSHGIVHLGPWGGEDGAPWSFAAKGEIYHISVTSDDHAIRSISFISGDGCSNTDKSPVFGTLTGPPEEITIDPRVEKLVLMEGIIGMYNFVKTVTQLSFTTSKDGVTTKHGPYGSKEKGTEFSCPLSEDPFAGFHGHCRDTLISIGVMVRNRVIQSWGGEGGASWVYKTKGTISHISVSYGDAIRAIRFTSVDASGRLEHSETYGDSDPKLEYHEIEIERSTEKLNGITGTFGKFGNWTVITSLAFTTSNLRTFGPFGKEIGTPFKYKVKDAEEVIAGFYGQAGGLIDAIGVYTRPSKESRNGVLVGPFGGSTISKNKWTYQPKGLISRIFLSCEDIRILSISFESKDEQGNIDRSPVYGRNAGKEYEINIDVAKGEKLTGINGTYDGYYVCSLCFSTDKKITYGPFGNTNGTPFSVTAKDGFFSGFHGYDYGKNHYSIGYIGVYVSPIA